MPSSGYCKTGNLYALLARVVISEIKFSYLKTQGEVHIRRSVLGTEPLWQCDISKILNAMPCKFFCFFSQGASEVIVNGLVMSGDLPRKHVKTIA